MTSDCLRILVRQARSAYRLRHGTAPNLISASPGRVNILGEHTDYNYGYVLPMAIDRWCACLAQPWAEDHLEISSQQREAVARLPADGDIEPVGPEDASRWANIIRGVLAGFRQRGIEVPPMRVMLDSNIPVGAGLSSSASLAVSFATLLEAASGFHLDPLDLALLCQKAEHNFVGVPCGIMDQYVCRHAREDCALLIDCESLTHRHVPVAEADYCFLCFDSGVSHRLADGCYAERRRECEHAARLLGLRKLRHAEPEDLDHPELVAEETLLRRARHVVSENIRSREAARLLAHGNWQRLGTLMTQGHLSLAEDYQVSVEELDTLVALADSIPHASAVLGARLTGAGFGGSVIFLVKSEQVEPVAQELLAAYTEAHPEAAANSSGWLASLPRMGAHLLTGG